MPVRVLYSFPYRIGAGRICHTAYQQVTGASKAGVEMMVFTGSAARPVDGASLVRTTLSCGPARLPVKWIGRTLACDWHDRQVASWLRNNWKSVDVVHGWPLASIRTIQEARNKGIPTFLERPNAHTRFAYRVVAEENARAGVKLPPNHDHEFNQTYLDHEEKEYALTDYLLCPSDFVKRTFEDEGVESSKLVRHHYGYDSERFSAEGSRDPNAGFVMIYAGVCEPRKGLHHALAAWLRSGVCDTGRFMVCGEFVPGYLETLSPMIKHPSVEVLGHRSDLPELMRQADAFVLSSVEEGSALVTYEARGSGCVLLVSDASGAICKHGVDALIHQAGDIEELAKHISMLGRDRAALGTLRKNSLDSVSEITWERAGETLMECYNVALANR